MEAENRRILEMRSGAARAPHFSAREAFKEVVGTEGVEAMQATPTGKIGGVDVYKMPTQNLSDRKAGPVRNPVTAPNTGFRPTK